jgi:hypothetical protein
MATSRRSRDMASGPQLKRDPVAIGSGPPRAGRHTARPE